MECQNASMGWSDHALMGWLDPLPLLQYLWDLLNLLVLGLRTVMLALIAPFGAFSYSSSKEEKPLGKGQAVVKVGKVVGELRASSGSIARALRGLLLPPVSETNRGKLTVVLDLDETLVMSYPANLVPASLRTAAEKGYLPRFEVTCDPGTGSPSKVAVFARPGLFEFLGRLSNFAEVIIFTAGLPAYAEPLVSLLDPHRTFFSGRLYRDSTVQLGQHAHVKDLSQLGRDLRRTVIVDNSPFSFLLQPANGIPITPFRGQPSDGHLLGVILPLLECLSYVRDIRPILNNHFKMARWFKSKGLEVCLDLQQ